MHGYLSADNVLGAHEPTMSKDTTEHAFKAKCRLLFLLSLKFRNRYLGKVTEYSPALDWRIFSHVKCLHQPRASKNS